MEGLSVCSPKHANLATGLAKNEGPLAGPKGFSHFFVEDIECRQADVGDFLVTESDFVARSCALRQHVHDRRFGCSGCSACQRQRQPGGPKNGTALLRRFRLKVCFTHDT